MTIDQSTFHAIFGPGDGPHVDDPRLCIPGDRRVLLALAQSMRPRTVVEIGVQAGCTARALLANVPCITHYLGIDVDPAAVTLDAMPRKQRREIPELAGSLVRSDPIFELLLTPSSLNLTAADLPDADFVYIDGSHAERDVQHDTDLAHAIARPGAVIAWHDYPQQSGVRAVVDRINARGGESIPHVRGTWVAFTIVRRDECS